MQTGFDVPDAVAGFAQVLTTGGAWRFQVWYRDPPAGAGSFGIASPDRAMVLGSRSLALFPRPCTFAACESPIPFPGGFILRSKPYNQRHARCPFPALPPKLPLMSHTIRPARSDEVALLPAIEQAASRLFVEAGIGGTLSVMPIAELKAVHRAGGLLVALDGDVPVGFAVLKVIGGGAHLGEMDVHPDHGRRGLGTALLRAGLDWARTRGLNEMTLTTYLDVPWNGPFYASNGFEVVPAAAWKPEMARLAEDEGVRPGSGRVMMVISL